MAIFAKKHDNKKKDAKAGPGAAVVTDNAVAAGPDARPGNADAQQAVTAQANPGLAQPIAAQAAVELPVLADAGADPSALIATPPPVSVEISLDDSLASDAIDIDPVRDADVVETFGGSGEGSSFGVADAIRLMRSLPTDTNPELVVRVVRLTLGAVDVSVEDIVQEAMRKEAQLRDGLRELREQSVVLERQLHAKRVEIALQEGELRETANMRERLRHASHQSHRPPPPPADAARVQQAPPKPPFAWGA